MSNLIKEIHFELLGVTRRATQEEIKKAYREQIKKWHPDKFPNQPDKLIEALERSKQINEAYSVLENYVPFTESKSGSKNSTKSTKKSSVNSDPSSKSRKSKIEHIRVESSNIYSVGYDSKNRILQVLFTNSGLYQYYGVPSYVFEELMRAESKGRYLNRNIAYKYRYD